MKIKQKKEKCLVFLLYVSFYIVSYLIKIDCLWKYIFGIECPGCGYSRALICAMQFDLKDAMSYNPMFWSFPILLLYFIFDGKVFKNRLINILVISIVFLGFIVLGLLRVFQH